MNNGINLNGKSNERTQKKLFLKMIQMTGLSHPELRDEFTEIIKIWKNEGIRKNTKIQKKNTRRLKIPGLSKMGVMKPKFAMRQGIRTK